MKKLFFFLFILFGGMQAASAQQSINVPTHTLTGNKWNVCDDAKFSKTYVCKNPLVTYTFYAGNTFDAVNKNGTKWKGTYTLTGGVLQLKWNDQADVTKGRRSYKITWLDENRFYASGKESELGLTVYTYFVRNTGSL